ncbi:hypothetical protein KCP73_13830 [Salmonella enterica subsp. enterica]|nr:hypothetical protein KCP73_13830 [Salmonella enterica subsp. enterica]
MSLYTLRDVTHCATNTVPERNVTPLDFPPAYGATCPLGRPAGQPIAKMQNPSAAASPARTVF